MAKPKKLSPLRQAVQDAHQNYPWTLRSYHESEAYKEYEEKRRNMEKKHKRVSPSCFMEKIKMIRSNSEQVGCDGWIADDYTAFIDVSKADEVQKGALEKWLSHQTLPVIPGVDMACFTWDYERFYEAFVRGEVAPIND